MSSSTWVPYTLPWDDAPIDLSFVYADERPAGRHGFCRAEGMHLVFEDGTRARFWGTELDGAANFPSRDEAEVTARRLAKFGINMVRAHMLDDGSSTPNIFQFNRAEPKTDTRSLDPESLDRFDYLVGSLKERGIYVFLDLLDYRKFLPGDEVVAVESLNRGARAEVYFDPRLIELQKEYADQLLGHTNPYTGLAYKDDPVVALTELQNESDLYHFPLTTEPFRTRLEAEYRRWADEHGVGLAAAPIDFTAPDPAMARFFTHVHDTYARDMIEYLRDLGVRAPIAVSNWSWNLGNLESQLAGDFLDDHLYWNFPHWDEGDGTVTDPAVTVARNRLVQGVFQRTLDKPFFVSEWGHCWPDEWRAESIVTYAAVAAFQGWGGLTHASYSSGLGPTDHISGRAAPHGGGTDYRYFDAFNDPAQFGLMYHAALLFRRGDVRQGETTAVIEIHDDSEGAWRLHRPDDVPALVFSPERHVTGMSLPTHRVDADMILPADRVPVELETGEVRSDTGEIGRNVNMGYGWIDTERTKVVYGFVGSAGTIPLDGLELMIDNDFATVALSSLTDDSIGDAQSLLLTAVGRADNAGARYDSMHRLQLDRGGPPIMIEAIEGTVRLRTSRPAMRVLMVGERGEAVAWLPTTTEDGWLCFRIGLIPDYDPDQDPVHSPVNSPDFIPGQHRYGWEPASSMYYLIRP